MSTDRKQIILGAYLGGVNHHTAWWEPGAGSQIDFSTFEHTARTAERGKFDFFFLAEGLALRERDGEIFDQDIVGRPDSLTVLAALAGVTEHLGLAATLNATFNEPYELARKLASLEQLSGGRSAWNVVTSSDAFTGGNFRRGGFLGHSERYERAAEFISAAQQLWDSWGDDGLVADQVSGQFLRDSDVGRFSLQGIQIDIRGRFTVPPSPQGRPVILQAGVSPQGRDFAVRNSDAIFSPFASLPEATEFYRDIKQRAAAIGRNPEAIKILPSASFVLGDSPEDAIQKHHEIRAGQLTGQTALILFEQVWNRDLSTYDPDGPLPDIDPLPDAPSFIQGKALHSNDRHGTVARYRAIAEGKNLSIRELAFEVFDRGTFVGTAEQVADELDHFVQNGGSDGFIIGSHLVPWGLDAFVDQVVPLLQERGSLREEYTGSTLRDNLGISAVPATL